MKSNENPPFPTAPLKPSEIINQAFLLLEFAVKVFTHARQGRLNPSDFNTPVEMRLPDGVLMLDHAVFDSPDEITNAAHNMVRLAFGFTASSLDSALESAGIGQGDLHDLVYMIRCAFAHPDQMIRPVWQVKGPFAREMRLSLPSGPLVLDMRPLDGRPFNIADIGGDRRYFELKDEVCDSCERRSTRDCCRKE
jgi:hypothetical protein